MNSVETAAWNSGPGLRGHLDLLTGFQRQKQEIAHSIEVPNYYLAGSDLESVALETGPSGLEVEMPMETRHMLPWGR